MEIVKKSDAVQFTGVNACFSTFFFYSFTDYNLIITSVNMKTKTVNYQAPEVEVVLLVPESCLLTASGQESGAEGLDLDFVDDLEW